MIIMAHTTVENIQEIIAMLREHGKMRFIVPATEEEISKYEKENGIVLPTQYRQWLMFSDGGELFLPASIQLYGVSHHPVIDVSDDWCPDDKHIVIGSTSWGDPILCLKNSEVISIFNHDTGCIEDDESWETFFAFLKDAEHFSDI